MKEIVDTVTDSQLACDFADAAVSKLKFETSMDASEICFTW